MRKAIAILPILLATMLSGRALAGRCLGTATPCNALSKQDSCAQQAGCWWMSNTSICIGEPKQCSSYQDGLWCMRTSGCRWDSGDGSSALNAIVQPCSQLRASPRETVDAVTLLIVNQSGDPLNLYWMDLAGREVFYRTIPNGGTYAQPTYGAHVWKLGYTNGVCYKALRAPFGGGTQRVTVRP